VINTVSIAYIESGGKLQPLPAVGGEIKKFFISAPSIEDVRQLLRSEVPAFVSAPVLFITR
jgi:hypothetical protein